MPPTRHALPSRPQTKKINRPNPARREENYANKEFAKEARRKRASTPEEGEIVEPPTGPASNVIVTQKSKGAAAPPGTKKGKKSLAKEKAIKAKVESLKTLPQRPPVVHPVAALPTPPLTAPRLPLYSRAIQEEATQLVCELLRYGIPADYLFRLGATNMVIADSFESLGYRPRFVEPNTPPPVASTSEEPIALPLPIADPAPPPPDTPISPVSVTTLPVEEKDTSFLNEAIVDLFSAAAAIPPETAVDDDFVPSPPSPVVPYVSHPPIRLSLEPLARRPTADELFDTPGTLSLSATRRSFRESSSVGTSSVIIELSGDEQSDEEIEMRLLQGESLDQLEAKERLKEKEQEIERMMAKLVRMERKNKAAVK